MSESSPTKQPTLQAFLPPEKRLSLPDDFNEEYFVKIANPSGRRFSTFPALAIADDKIVQTYGTTSVDVTHQFYAGPETVYSISPVPSIKDKKSPDWKHAKTNRKKKRKDIGGHLDDKKLDFIPPSLDGSIRGLETQMNEPARNNNNSRRSANSLGERKLGLAPIRKLASAGTDLSSDIEFLDELKGSLKRRESKLHFQAWKGDIPDICVAEKSDSTKHSAPLRSADSANSKEENVLYMTGSNTSRVVSKGELKKKKRVKPIAHSGMANATPKVTTGKMSLAISGKAPEGKVTKDVGSFQIRQKYTDDIERKWFQDVMQKAKEEKGKTEDQEWLKRRYDLRLDMFYSPEPGDSESHTDSDSTDSLEGLNSGQYNGHCNTDEAVENVLEQSFSSGTQSPLKTISGKSKLATKQMAFIKSKGTANPSEGQAIKDNQNLILHFDSTDVLVGKVGELEESSGSDIETCLQNGELQQRRCKHKMYRKRKRQQKRYKPFIQAPLSPPESDHDVNSQDQSKVNLHNFSIKQLRRMRLKTKKKVAQPCLKGLQKFRQVANTVFIFVQFRKMLQSMRLIRRKAHKRSLKKARKVKWNNDLEMYSKFERQNSPAKEPIHEKFMKEFGLKLLEDLAKLPISIPTQPYLTEDSDVESGVNDEDKGRRKGWSFYHEVRKADISDIKYISDHRNHHKPFVNFQKPERRLSAPGSERPEYIAFTLPEKPATKRSHRKNHKARSRSPAKSKGKSKQATLSASTLGRAPNHLPPLVTPPGLGASSPQKGVTSAPGAHKHSHGECLGAPKNKQHSRKRSKSPSKRSRSHSPLEPKKSLSHPPREVKIWPEVYRPRSYSASHAKFKTEVSLRELLKDADIPAKEVTIQIIERKRKKRRRKMADAEARREMLAYQRKIAEEKAELERERLAELQRKEEARILAEKRKAQQKTSPFISSGVAWNQRKPRALPSWTNKELDSEITKLSGLFFEMRNCSYIRWNNKDQAILRRLAELEEVKI